LAGTQVLGSGVWAVKRSLLVLVLVSPWLVAVWVGLHNLRQPRQLQLLTGTTPALPIGGWLLLSSSLGATLGATAVGVLLRTGRSPGRRRWPQASLEENTHHAEADDDGRAGEEANTSPRRWRDRDTASSLREPPPIVDVPFRVVGPARTPGPESDAPPPPPSDSPACNDDDWQPSQPEAW